MRYNKIFSETLFSFIMFMIKKDFVISINGRMSAKAQLCQKRSASYEIRTVAPFLRSGEI